MSDVFSFYNFVQEARELITLALSLFQIILKNEDPIVQLTTAIKQHFTESNQFVHFFVDTLVKHFNLWSSVLSVEREVSIIQREIAINSLDFANLSLNLAMPAEYLNPPRDESGVDVEGEPTGDGTQPGSTEVETTVPLSSVETVFNKLTQSRD